MCPLAAPATVNTTQWSAKLNTTIFWRWGYLLLMWIPLFQNFNPKAFIQERQDCVKNPRFFYCIDKILSTLQSIGIFPPMAMAGSATSSLVLYKTILIWTFCICTHLPIAHVRWSQMPPRASWRRRTGSSPWSITQTRTLTLETSLRRFHTYADKHFPLLICLKLVPQIDPSVPQPVVQSRRRPLLGPWGHACLA